MIIPNKTIASHYTHLVRLGNVCEDNVNHADEHAVLVWVAGVFDDRDDVCALLGL